MSACNCGSGKNYAACCGRLHSGAEIAATAEALMRSRYSAYVLRLAPYLLESWHASTRPQSLDLAEDGGYRWLGLEILRHQERDLPTRPSNLSPATELPGVATVCTRSVALSARTGAGTTSMARC